MKVHVQFEAQLREVAGVGKTDAELPEATDLLSALKYVSDAGTTDLQQRLWAEDGAVQSSILVFVNEQPVSPESAGGHVLQDGDTVLLLPPISGG